MMRRGAAIDVGSSATRLSTLSVTALGSVAHTDLRRFDMRLGADVFAQNQVSAARQEAMVALFVRIADSFHKAGIAHYRAVATSAMRDAANGAAVAAAIQAASGLRLEIISGAEEGALSRRALVRALGSVDPAALLVDLGGGSLEIERLSVGSGQSVPMGTVRLLAAFPQLRGPLTPQGLRSVSAAIAARLQAVIGPVAPAAQAIGTGGNLEALAKLLGHASGLVAQFDASALDGLVTAIAPTTLAQRVRTYPVRPDRVDLFLPAILVLQALATWYGVQHFVVPHTGLREALLVDLIDAQVVTCAGAVQPSAHVSITLALFDLLFALHGLWAPARGCLTQVATLYGQHMASPASRNASFVQVQAACNGFTGEESAVCMAVLANLTYGQAPPLPQKLARLAAIFTGLVVLGSAIAAKVAPADVVSVCRRLRLDILASPACLYTGEAVAAAAAQPLARALGCALVLR